jgi:hypothetical protein
MLRFWKRGNTGRASCDHGDSNPRGDVFSAAGGWQYLFVKMTANIEAFSA